MAQYYEGIGRRKSASARVRVVTGGTGNFLINDKDAADYLPRLGDVDKMLAPIRLVGQEKSVDITVKVSGGGMSGQRDAIVMGLARALIQLDESTRPALKDKKFLRRDARVKERKKPGLKRARKAPTYTKR